MSDYLPPLFGSAPSLTCSRWIGDRNCGAPATWHVIWTAQLDNGLCCDEHMAEARRVWAFFAAHPHAIECDMPGTAFLAAENRCVVDEGWLGLRELAHADITESQGGAS